MKYLALCAALLATPAVAETVTINNDGGGRILLYAAFVKIYNDNGSKVRITGVCGSACTLYLSANNYCVDRNARLVFHAASYEGNPKAARLFTKYMMSKYPPKVRSWINQNGGLTKKLITLRGAAMAKAVVICDPAPY